MPLIVRLTNLFWLWTILGVTWAWFVPPHFSWFKALIPAGLGVIMLGMGITLSLADFRAAFALPRAVGLGVLSQFCVMPLLGFTLSRVAGLPPDLAVGIILVSCCPGGTASNVIAYLARANVAVSVLMTMCSTILAVVLTPVLTKWLAGALMDIDALALLRSTAQIVLLPVIAGILLNHLVPNRILRPLKAVSPLISVVVIVLIVGCIVGLRRDSIREAAGALLISIFILHAFGFLFGYLIARIFKFPEDYRRTLSIEVGMQNSGLGAALASKHFSAAPDTAVPSAISAFFHCLIGSLAAGFWRTRPTRSREQSSQLTENP